MRTIKKTKTFKLLLLLSLLSVALSSCSPTDELSREVTSVDNVDESDPWVQSVFIIVGYNDSWDVCSESIEPVYIKEPIYELVLADIDEDTKELISIVEVISDADSIFQQYEFYSNGYNYEDIPNFNPHPYTRYFIELNSDSDGCSYPLVINPNLDMQEQLDTHLNPNLFESCFNYYGWNMDEVDSVLNCDYTNSWLN